MLPDAEVRQGIVERCERLKAEHKGTPDRWLDPSLYHLSLQALPAQEQFIDRAIDIAGRVRAPPFELRLDQAAGFFNKAKNTTPWWLSPSSAPAEIKELRRPLRDQLKMQRLAWGRDGFSAHLTLIYDAGRALPARPVLPPLTWDVREFVLLRGETGRGFKFHYEVLGRWPLTAGKREPLHSPQRDLWDN